MNNDDQGRTLSILLLFIRMHSGSDQISVRAGMCAVSGSGMRMRGLGCLPILELAGGGMRSGTNGWWLVV